MNHDKSFLNVAYWNACGIQDKIHQLYHFLTINFIDIICISETFLKSKDRLHQHPDYCHSRVDRPDDRAKGGVLILIRRSLSHTQLPLVNTMLVENVGVEISTSRGKI